MKSVLLYLEVIDVYIKDVILICSGLVPIRISFAYNELTKFEGSYWTFNWIYQIMHIYVNFREVMLEKQLTGHRVDRSICAWFWDQILAQGESLKVIPPHSVIHKYYVSFFTMYFDLLGHDTVACTSYCFAYALPVSSGSRGNHISSLHPSWDATFDGHWGVYFPILLVASIWFLLSCFLMIVDCSFRIISYGWLSFRTVSGYTCKKENDQDTIN